MQEQANNIVQVEKKKSKWNISRYFKENSPKNQKAPKTLKEKLNGSHHEETRCTKSQVENTLENRNLKRPSSYFLVLQCWPQQHFIDSGAFAWEFSRSKYPDLFSVFTSSYI